MKSFHKNILRLIFIIMITNSCEKECNRKNIYHYIDDNYKTNLIYTGFDTLVFFRNSTGITYTFIGEGKNTSYNSLQEAYDCGNLMHYENYAFKYVSNNFASPLYIGQYTNGNISCVTNIAFNNHYFEGDVNFVSNKTDMDSLIVGNKIYKNIEVIYTNKNNKAYFNKEFGVVKMEMINSEEWVLLSKK